MQVKRIVVGALLLFVIAACNPPAPQFTAADEQAILAEAQKVPGQFVSADFASWAAGFEEDGFLQPPNGKTAHGRAALMEWAKAFPPVEAAAFTEAKVKGEGNYAYYTSNYNITIKGAPAPDSGKQLAVFHRQADNKWLAAGVSFNSDLPLPGTPPAKPAAKK